MSRRNNKHNAERKRNYNTNRNQRSEQAADMAASMAFGAIISKIFGTIPEPLRKVQEKVESDRHNDDKPFSGIRQVSDNHLETGVIVPADGTAVEMSIPEGFEVFISEDGKPMIRKKADEDKAQKKENKPVTYHQIAKDLFKGSEPYYWNVNTDVEVEAIDSYECNADFEALFNCNTKAQVKRLMAFNKLQNIAIWLNDGWRPDFDDAEEDKYYISYNGGGVTSKDKDGEYLNFSVHSSSFDPAYDAMVYFKTEKLALEAIGIMGKNSLEDLFCTAY